jgi:hypothetical protein
MIRMTKASSQPRIPEGAVEEVRFRPELIAWWGGVAHWAKDIHACHRWLAKDHPMATGSDSALEQRSIPTAILCVSGSARVESSDVRLDLAPGEMLTIAPGAWHRHLPLRPGAVVYRQGFIFARSDFFLMDSHLHFVATIPEEPSRRTMEEILLSPEPDRRLALARRHLASVVNENAKPRPMSHPAVLAMIYALQNTLHLRHGVEAAVHASGLSRAQAYRWFKADTGVGLATMRRHLRQELAAWRHQEARIG